jgi:hypothetical protein
MNQNDSHDLEKDGADFDELDARIREVLKEEGAVIPDTIEDVRRAKEKLKRFPVTVPPHLRESSAILARIKSKQSDNGSTVPEECTVVARRKTSPQIQHRAQPEFVEAIAIAQVTRLHSDSEYPLGRKRCQKLTYFSHRKVEDDVTKQYLKKAAGPYSPWVRYQGPEKIALGNKYVKRAKIGVYDGFVVGENIDKIDQYVSRYPVCVALDWVVDKFRFRKNEELELLTTVDFAAVELKRGKTAVTWQAVKAIIAENREWAPKLDRAIFSDSNILEALTELRELFPATYCQ